MSNSEDLWNDEEFGEEFLKFEPADQTDSTLYDENVEVMYVFPCYDTIREITNSWNKKRMRINVHRIIRAFNTPYTEDEIEKNNGNLVLDMGARLFNALKKARANDWTTVKILKLSNPRNKFDVRYYVSEYLLEKQEEITKTAKNKKK